jgi:hypothetical protein
MRPQASGTGLERSGQVLDTSIFLIYKNYYKMCFQYYDC